jgi:hypothetical protein
MVSGYILGFLIYLALSTLLILFLKKYIKKNKYLIAVLLSLLLFFLWIYIDSVIVVNLLPMK